MNIKKSLFCYKMCHNLKKFKGYEENFPHRCRPLPFEICVKFLEKVTRNKGVKEKKS